MSELTINTEEEKSTENLNIQRCKSYAKTQLQSEVSFNRI